jgi:hypothetical protein
MGTPGAQSTGDLRLGGSISACCTASPFCPVARPMGRPQLFRRSRRVGRNCLGESLSEGTTAAVRNIPNSYPHGRVVTGALHASRLTIDAGVLQALCQRGTQQNVVETQTAIAFPALPHVIPKRIHRFFGMERANGIGPPLREQGPIRRAALRLQQGVAIPGLRRIDV